MKLWHDDVRPPPYGWLWATHNEAAKNALLTGRVEVCSLDHDLGATPIEGPYVRGKGAETGLDLVRWMVNPDNMVRLPKVVMIHSWNIPGARAMGDELNRAPAHVQVIVQPYDDANYA